MTQELRILAPDSFRDKLNRRAFIKAGSATAGMAVVLMACGGSDSASPDTTAAAGGEKLASGDVIKVSEVVRDLWRREQDRGLSAGEKRMLAKARQILISELALAEKTDEERASNRLDEVLAS